MSFQIHPTGKACSVTPFCLNHLASKDVFFALSCLIVSHYLSPLHDLQQSRVQNIWTQIGRDSRRNYADPVGA